MAIVKLYSTNPKDGTSTFDKVKFYEADDSNGTNATAIATVDIDTSTVDVVNPGFTTYVHTSGSTSKYYASTWYNSSNSAESSYSTWIQGGQDRWDAMFKEEMDDANEEVWSSSDRQKFKDAALEALYPEFFRQVIDTSLTIVNNSTTQTYTYTVPHGIFKITEIGVGTVNKTASADRTFEIVKADYWKFERNLLHFTTLSGLSDGETIRIVGCKKYQEVGEVPKRLDPLAMLHMRMSAYLQLADDFPRFKTWARLQQGTKVSFENLRVHAREFERKFNDWKKILKDQPLAVLS